MVIINNDLVNKKLKDGWIRSWMMIEVLASSKEAAMESLKRHMDKMEKENKTLVVKKEFQDVQEVETKVPGIQKGYSQTVEVEILTENYDKLLFITMNYGPSAIEILEPDKIKIDAGEAQGILNSVAEMIHRFAAIGIGGVVINR